jgi:hypothetical protein
MAKIITLTQQDVQTRFARLTNFVATVLLKPGKKIAETLTQRDCEAPDELAKLQPFSVNLAVATY